VQGKWVPFYSQTLMGDAAVGAVNADEAVFDITTFFPVLKNNLEQKKVNQLTGVHIFCGKAYTKDSPHLVQAQPLLQ
jgi:hypothetical protein